MVFSLVAPHPALVDAAWMTEALRRAGTLRDARIIGIDRTPIGNGLVGNSFRFALTYDRAEPGAPHSVIGKFPAADPSSRFSGSQLLLYLREVSFYRELAQTVAIRTPLAYLAEIDPDTHDFTLILEDLTPARQIDQFEGCSLAEARIAIAEAAALHAPRWGDPALETLDWLAVRPAAVGPQISALLPGVIHLFKLRYDGQLEAPYVAMVERLAEVVPRMQADRSGPRTLAHGDFRLDNILFDVRGGAEKMATLDWQTLALGAGATDIAYFLSAGLDPALRRAHEVELVRLYHAELLRRGVQGYDWDTCWHDYRRFAIHGILMGVFSALAVTRTERGDRLFLKMTRGACVQAAEHDSFGFWPG